MFLLSSCSMSAVSNSLWCCLQLRTVQEENRVLRGDNSALAAEVEQMNRVASYVGSRVARVLAGARRTNNYNAALVGELKRWNRKLEVGNTLSS